eukprot:gnl/Dysnectes_brevis/9534_a17809_227.p1 GENE.gnl/Dysnectes_brevis/9534_a17809_227~~gnl/Dysnectes_brevis/9534_a17809_227.p1  ORF type:complete len:121 (+),score=15.55 gnl/Dysnectes_brevis/9534_a17809_227:116-478(+)
MERHSCLMVLSNGIIVLNNFSQVRSLRSDLLRSQGPEMIAKALRLHGATDKDVVEAAAYLLINLSHTSDWARPDIVRRLTDSEVIPAFQALQKRYVFGDITPEHRYMIDGACHRIKQMTG